MFGWKKKGRKTAPPMAVYAGPEFFERRSKKNGKDDPSGDDGINDIPVPEQETEPGDGGDKGSAKEKRILRKKYPDPGKNQSLCNDVYGGPDMIDDEPVEEPVEDQND